MKIDSDEYIDNFLKKIEMRITDKKDEIPHFNPKYLRQAVMNEMNLADEETNTFEIPDNREEALKQAEERILKFIKSSIDDRTKREKPIPPKRATHTIKSHTIPQNISWENIPVRRNAFSFQCVVCGKEYEIQKGVFTESQTRSEEGLTQTDRFMIYGKTATGNVVAFIVAFVIGLIISLIAGKTTTTYAIVSAVIFLILRKILVPTFMNKLPIWIYKCGQCRKDNFIAFNGNSVAIGKEN